MQHPSRSPDPSSLRARLLIAVAGFLAGLALAEIAVRVLGAAPRVGFFQREQFQLSPNIRIGWEPIPNPSSSGDSLDARFSPEERNSLGFRDYEHSLEKIPGIYRILVIGDSIAKGLGIPDPNMTFPMLLEKTLKEEGVPCEVLNFGVEGYNTQQEVETLKDKGLRYAPDLVILAYSLNDRTWPAHHLYRELLDHEASSGLASEVRLAPWMRHSALYLFLRFRVLDGWLRSRRQTDARTQELFDLVQRDTVEEYFSVLSDLSRRHGFQVLVAVFPYLDDLINYKHLNEDLWVKSLSSRQGFHHYDLLSAFVDCERRVGQTIAFDEVHPNNIGHLCAGRVLARVVRHQIIRSQRTP